MRERLWLQTTGRGGGILTWFGAAFGAVTKEGEIAQVGVRCWVLGQQLRWFKTIGEYTSIFPNLSISSI
jgi:hypothetical protein